MAPVQHVKYDLSDQIGKYCYCRFVKKNPEIDKFGTNGTEVSGMEIKVRSFASGTETYYAPGKFQREFSRILREEDIKRVIEMIPGTVLYAHLPSIDSVMEQIKKSKDV